MADKNKHPGRRQGNQSNPGNLTGHGSGQQTAGKRGQKMEKKEAGYHRSSEEKSKRGAHGGNR